MALEEVAKQKLDTILATLSPGRQRAIVRIVEGKNVQLVDNPATSKLPL